MDIIRLSHEESSGILVQARQFLTGLTHFYPGFDHWFANKVVGSLDSIVLVAMEKNCLAGIALGKVGIEPKLRCVRVHDDLQGSGLGLKLIDRMLSHLESETPHCTVAEEMMHDYSRAFVKRYGFRLSDVTKGEYRQNKLEYHWN
ncbi:putative N-acetyltransferase [Ralstonia phage RP31]|uniref:Putative N-acetyltransferase n=2 Tax=Ripduovirus RP12 TaxID=2560700 RepID=A0A1L7N199_9CAUD|nr:acetyltransferase [Ralstonia phage RP12]BAW19245.1 putative N-acetyltransferase [Ralstonia phage RP12]BAW19531.1 putative N-acetyltransferase [Ralstonia phage RP31]